MDIGDKIRDVEDEDSYYEGVVVSLNPLSYRITKVVWCGEEEKDMVNLISTIQWNWLVKI